MLHSLLGGADGLLLTDALHSAQIAVSLQTLSTETESSNGKSSGLG
jgi:hypothetical protein